MTEKLYEVDSYVQNFTAQVVSCTPVPGGFAVGDARTKAVRQIVTAVADGAVAAHYAEEFLLEDAVKDKNLS